MENEHEELWTACCRKLCKTDKMSETEFDDFTEEHCEDCPIGDLEEYYMRQCMAYRDEIIKKIKDIKPEL